MLHITLSLRTTVSLPEAKEARKILEDFGIDLDSSTNGVPLPYKPGIGEGGYHPSIHNGEYYRNVVTLLRKATTRETCNQTLNTINQKGLRNGTFPK